MRTIYAAILIVLISLASFASLTDARSVERAAPQTASDDHFVDIIWNSSWHEMNWDKSADGSLWLYVDGVMLVKNNEGVVAIWGIKIPEDCTYGVPYRIVTDNLTGKAQAFADAVNSTELKVELVENPHSEQGYWFFFKQELQYNGTLESIEGPVTAMRNHLEQVLSSRVWYSTPFQNLVVSDQWFWDSARQWLGSSWAR